MDLTPSCPFLSRDKDTIAANTAPVPHEEDQGKGQTEATDFCTTPSIPDNYTSVRTSPSVSFPLPLTVPLVRKEEADKCFDMLGSLWGAGVPHVFLLVMSFLSLKSLALVEQVSTLWRDIIEELLVWKYAIKRQVNTNSLWRGLFERRSWLKYESQEDTSSRSVSNFYRRLYQKASRDINSLEVNWRSGHYTLTCFQTGSGILCLQYDSDKIVSGHCDHTVQIWDRKTLELKNTPVGHKDFVWCLQFREDVVISGSGDTSVKVWDIQTGQIVNNLLHHRGWVRCLKFNSKSLVTGSHDQMVAVWDFKSPTVITLRMVLKGHDSYVMAVDVTDAYIISGSWDKTIKVWDSSTGGLLHTIPHSFEISSLCYRGSLIVSGGYDGTIRIWDIDTGISLREWGGHKGRIWFIAVNEKRIVTGSQNRTVKVWSVSAALELSSPTDTLCITTLKEHTGSVYGVQFDDFHVISCDNEGTVCIHDFLDPVPVDPITDVS